MALIFTGPVRIEDVGSIYDIAIGYQDPTSGNTQMYGYVISRDGQFQETTDLADEEHLVQIASPLSTDRFSRYPRVTQGDWSGGEGQLFYQNPQQYYTSSGMDCSKPGNLQLLPPTVTPTGWQQVPSQQAYGACEHDGWNWCSAGGMTSGNVIINGTNYTAFGGGTIYAFCRSPLGIFAAVVGGSTPGIWLMSMSSPGTGTKYTSDAVLNSVDTFFQCPIAYFNGALYYIATANTINTKVAGDGAAGTVVYTSSAYEPNIVMLCEGESGLIFATAGTVANSGSYGGQSILYAFDGAVATRIAKIPGMVRYGYTQNGVTYILVENDQVPGTDNCYSLYALSGSVLTVIFDQRYVLSDFQPVNPNSGPPYRNGCKVTGDGRYLYVAIPGYFGLQVDPTNNAIFRVSRQVVGNTTNPQSMLVNHAMMVNPQIGLMDVVAQHSTGLPNWNQSAKTYIQGNFATTNAVGTLQTSYYDFGSPSTVKLFQSIEFDLQAALSGGDTIQVQFRTDNASSWTTVPSTNQYTMTNGNLLVTLPSNTKGYRIQFLLTFTQVSGASGPRLIVKAWSINAQLAYVYTLTVSCRKDQKVRGAQPDPQKAQTIDLLANIKNIRKLAGGYCTLWVPDETAKNASPPGVSQVQARLEDFKKTTPPGVSPAYIEDPETGSRDMEGDVELTFTEIV